MIESEEEKKRDLSRLVVLRTARLVTTGDAHEPYRVVGPGGEVVEPVSVFLRDMLAAGRSGSTLRRRIVNARISVSNEVASPSRRATFTSRKSSASRSHGAGNRR